MCGIPGSGKSTLIKKYLKYFPEVIVVSSDDIRKELLHGIGHRGEWHQNNIKELTDEEKEKIEKEVWDIIKIDVATFLLLGGDVFLDSTNTEQKYIEEWIEFAEKFNYRIRIINMVTPLDICIKHNLNRIEIVPNDVMSYMYNSYIMTLGWLYTNHKEKVINSEHLL